MNQKIQQSHYSWKSWLVCLLSLIFLTGCTIQDPISIKFQKGNITGRVLPSGIQASVSATQGIKIVATTPTDSAGYFYLANLSHGVYTLIFEAQNYGSHFENGVIVYEGGTTAIQDIVLKHFPEQISGSEPRNNQQEYALDAPITLHFNQPMNQAAVETAFSISPMLTGSFYWNFNSTLLTFQPEPQFMAAQNYQLILSTTAKTLEGVALAFPFNLTFNTTSVKVIQTSPLNGTVGVATSLNIWFNFNSAIDKIQLPHAFSIKPPISGEFKWNDSNSFLFVPGTLLEPETDYQIILDSLLADVYGKKTGEPFIFYFSTEPTRVVYNTPQNGASAVSRSTQLLISFNAEMNQTTVQSAFQMTPTVSGQFRWDSNSSFRFVPNTPLLPTTQYNVQIGTGAKTAAAHTLAETFEFIFTTAP
jgi:hypothetical protein